MYRGKDSVTGEYINGDYLATSNDEFIIERKHYGFDSVDELARELEDNAGLDRQSSINASRFICRTFAFGIERSSVHKIWPRTINIFQSPDDSGISEKHFTQNNNSYDS